MNEGEAIDPAETANGDGAPRPKWTPRPKPERTEQDWANIAYLAKLRECLDEEKPEGLPLACIVHVLDYSEVPMAHERYAMVSVYGPDDRVWRMCVQRGAAQTGDDLLFVSEDAALPVDDRWRDPLVCSVKEKVYKYGHGIKVRRLLPHVKRNIYANNCGVLYPLDAFAKELELVRLGEDCSGRLNIESHEELKIRQNAKKPKLQPSENDRLPGAVKKRLKANKPKASYQFLSAVRWMRKGQKSG